MPTQGGSSGGGDGDGGFNPFLEKSLQINYNSANGEILSDNSSKSLGSFVQNTSSIFYLYLLSSGDGGSILSIPKDGIVITNSGTINNNPSTNGPVDIVQGSYISIEIRLDLSVIGSKDLKISVTSNDTFNQKFDLTFFFTVTEPSVSNPDISVLYNNSQIQTNSVIYLGSFPKDGTSDISFDIFNYADASLVIPKNGINITTIGSNEALIVNPSSSDSVSLAFNSSANFKVRLDNSSLGSKSAVILITSNDPDENPFLFTLSYLIAKPFDLIIKESSTEVLDGDTINLGSFNKKSIINKSISMSNRGISYGVKLLNIFGEGDVTLTNIPSLPYVLQPNEANAVQFIAKFGSSVVGKRNASLKIQWEVSTS